MGARGDAEGLIPNRFVAWTDGIWVDHDGTQHMMMEFGKNGSLRERITAAPLALSEAAIIFHQLLEGVSIMHANNVYHRDLKPENVVFTADGHALVIDFGVAIDCLFPVTVHGSPLYMPPEMCAQDPIQAGYTSERHDVYSLGCILRDLLDAAYEHWADAQLLMERMTSAHPHVRGCVLDALKEFQTHVITHHSR